MLPAHGEAPGRPHSSWSFTQLDLAAAENESHFVPVAKGMVLLYIILTPYQSIQGPPLTPHDTDMMLGSPSASAHRQQFHIC